MVVFRVTYYGIDAFRGGGGASPSPYVGPNLTFLNVKSSASEGYQIFLQ